MPLPDNFAAAAHDPVYAPQAHCRVDDWHKTDDAVRMARHGVACVDAGDYAGYELAVEALDDMRDTAFVACRCGRCGDSDNHVTDGASVVDAMMPALELAR